jgi:ADP-heptose:LPS heptosyltransferase
LPLYLRRHRRDFPVRSHYLLAEPAAIQKWRSRFALLGDGLKVGIAWRAGSGAPESQRRTIDLSRWASLLSLPNVHFVNLQHGDCRQEIEALAEWGATLHHWADADNRDDLDGLAGRVAALDLVITVGNSLAHLAGALGVETWALVPRSFAWRWLTDQRRTPWYPSVKIYRQEQPDQWESLLSRVRQDLLNQYTQPDEVKPMHGVPRPHWVGQPQGALATPHPRTR